MFFDPDTDIEELDDDAIEAPVANEALPIYTQAGLDPLDELAFHIDDAMQTKAMLAEADALATQRPALEARYIASLTEAGTEVTQALHLARQQTAVAALPAIERPDSFAERVEAGKGEIALV